MKTIILEPQDEKTKKVLEALYGESKARKRKLKSLHPGDILTFVIEAALDAMVAGISRLVNAWMKRKIPPER